MPALPPGEHDLRALALRYQHAESEVIAGLTDAATGNRRHGLRVARQALDPLRLLNARAPVHTAYLHEHPEGDPTAVSALAGSLASKLDAGVVIATGNATQAIGSVTEDTIEQTAPNAVTALIDRTGRRWVLGAFAVMLTSTIGRQATSRGVADRAGQGRTVTIDAGDCELCAGHAGDAVVGEDPLPPYHVNCSCTATAAES